MRNCNFDFANTLCNNEEFDKEKDDFIEDNFSHIDSRRFNDASYFIRDEKQVKNIIKTLHKKRYKKFNLNQYLFKNNINIDKAIQEAVYMSQTMQNSLECLSLLKLVDYDKYQDNIGDRVVGKSLLINSCKLISCFEEMGHNPSIVIRFNMFNKALAKLDLLDIIYTLNTLTTEEIIVSYKNQNLNNLGITDCDPPFKITDESLANVSLGIFINKLSINI